MGNKKIKCIKGIRDIYPPEIDIWKKVEKIWEDTFKSFGFKEIRIPIFEMTEVFQRGIGESTDIVEKEMYTFKDKSGNSITLRPEGTASVVRAYIEHDMNFKIPYNKFYYMGPMFRYERPQKGRYRQFYQIGVEIFDDNSPEIEAETLVMIDLALKKLGFKEFSLNINSIGCKNCRPEFIKILKKELEGKREELCDDCKRRIETNPLRILDCKRDGCKRVISECPKITDFLCEDCKKHHLKLKGILRECKIEFVENPLLVRGLDYYVKTTFEVLVENLGAQNAILGGGRYDGLVKDLGGPDISGFGFALGLDRMVMALPEDVKGKYVSYPEFYLAYADEKSISYSFKVAKIIRERGITLFTNFKGKSLKSQMRLANKLKTKYVVIVGESEVLKNSVILKDMENGSQEELSLEEFEKFLHKKNKKGD